MAPKADKGPSAKELKRLAKLKEQAQKESRAHVETGVGFADKAKWQQAIQSYTQAIEVDPENTDAYLQRGRAEKEVKEYDKSISDYSQVLELDPTESSAFSGRGTAYECIGGVLPTPLHLRVSISG